MARPREFEPDEAMEKVKDVFWRLGFEGASMSDLEAATGLGKQSLYRVFGDKRGMYLSALRHYEAHEAHEAVGLLKSEGTAKERVARLFDYVIDAAVASNDRRGCFLCNAAVDQAQLDEETQKFVTRLMAATRAAFADALKVSETYRRNAKKRDAKAVHLLAGYLGLRVMIKANMGETALRAAAKALVESIQ